MFICYLLRFVYLIYLYVQAQTRAHLHSGVGSKIFEFLKAQRHGHSYFHGFELSHRCHLCPALSTTPWTLWQSPGAPRPSESAAWIRPEFTAQATSRHQPLGRQTRFDPRDHRVGLTQSLSPSPDQIAILLLQEGLVKAQLFCIKRSL